MKENTKVTMEETTENEQDDKEVRQKADKEVVHEDENRKEVKYEFQVNTQQAAEAITTVLSGLEELKRANSEIEVARDSGILVGTALTFCKMEVIEDCVCDMLIEIIDETTMQIVKAMPQEKLSGIKVYKRARADAKTELIADIKRSLEDLPKEQRTWEAFYGVLAAFATKASRKASNEHVQKDKADGTEEPEAEN